MASNPISTAKGVVVLGATSAIARAAATEFALNGYTIVLGSRDQEENEILAKDIRVRCGVEVLALPFEAEDFASHQAVFERSREFLGDALEGVLVCFGLHGRQADVQADFGEARHMMDVNYIAAASVLELFARHFETAKRGFVAAVSSVSGDRGRQSNYVYGSSKAALTTYLQGLRNRLFRSGVHVLTVKPGFVDTKMTFGASGLFLVAAPEQTGRHIYRAVQKQRNVIYTPWFWRYIMLMLRCVPEFVFKRLKL